MKILLETLKEKFKDKPYNTLGDMTSKIATISKVRDDRYGELDFREYDEVRPTQTDEFGAVLASSSAEDLGPANERVMKKQILNAGDLLISYRGKHSYSVGRVGNNYKRVVVGNNSTIRIQFNDEHKQIEQLPVMIQAYLKQECVQDYLRRCSVKANNNRHLINAQILQELPIPNFVYEREMSFSDFHNKRLSILDTAKKIELLSQKIIDKTFVSLNEDLVLHTDSPSKLKELALKDEETLEYLEDVLGRLGLFQSNY